MNLFVCFFFLFDFALHDPHYAQPSLKSIDFNSSNVLLWSVCRGAPKIVLKNQATITSKKNRDFILTMSRFVSVTKNTHTRFVWPTVPVYGLITEWKENHSQKNSLFMHRRRAIFNSLLTDWKCVLSIRFVYFLIFYQREIIHSCSFAGDWQMKWKQLVVRRAPCVAQCFGKSNEIWKLFLKVMKIQNSISATQFSARFQTSCCPTWEYSNVY